MNEQDKRNLQATDFEFVQADQKIYDKKFETKPIGYFKDAMIRFGKNKTNVIASTILGIIILMAILVPILSNRNYKDLESELAFLPPKVPILENWGILDGTSMKEEVPVDVSTIDPETGLGLPAGYPVDQIVMDTLVNYEQECIDKVEVCAGGQNQLSVDSGEELVSIISSRFMTLYETQNPVVTLDIEEFVNENNSVLNVYLKSLGEWILIGSITEAGVHNISPYETDGFDEVPMSLITQIKVELVSSTNSDKVSFNSWEANDDSSDTPIFEYSGYEMSLLVITPEDPNTDASEGGGLWVRSKGSVLMADFKFRNYVAAFGEHELFMPNSEYLTIVEEHADVCIQSPHPDTVNYPDGWVFSEGCPITQIYSQTEVVVVEGIEYFSYNAVINYQLYAGYDEIPNFIFGTDFNGRDLFTLLWVALRTSLLIGLTVALINVTVGIVYGAISGYYGGTVDLVLQRITEVIGRIPWLVTLSIFVSFFGPGIQTLILILIVSGWIGPQAVTRTQFYRYKGREYVLASRTLGAKDSRLIFRHILPNGIGTIITSSILMIPYAIFSESTISYLGFGVGHGQEFHVLGLTFSGVSVGVLLSDGRNYLLDRPYLTIFPALLISILMITFNMFGNALRDAFNPALRGSE